MNSIEIVRQESSRFFSLGTRISDREIFLSPTGQFRAEATGYSYSGSEGNIEILKIEVFDNKKEILQFSFLVNEGTFFHSWITKNQQQYLICAEDLCGGQTIIDLTNTKMSSYTTSDDGFIWTKHLLSPNNELLAVFGCSWGSSFFLTVYRFDNPMDLPLKVVYNPSWTGYDVIEWIDNKKLRVKKSENEVEILEL
jgi:hypothetical protein